MFGNFSISVEVYRIADCYDIGCDSEDSITLLPSSTICLSVTFNLLLLNYQAISPLSSYTSLLMVYSKRLIDC